MKKLFWSLFLVLPLLLAAPAAQAFSVETKDNYRLPSGEVHDGNLYIGAGIITIDGQVNGDVIAAAQNLNVDGKIEGDLIAFSQNLTINGEVSGSVRIFAQSININGSVGRNVNAFASTISLGSQSEVGSDLLVFGASGSFDGLVNDSLYGGLAQAAINGKIGHDVSLNLESDYNGSNLFIGSDAVIGGDLKYTAKNEAEIQNPEAISGEINYQPQTRKVENWGNKIMNRFFQLAALILIGIILLTLKKKSFTETAKTMKEKPWQTPLTGLVFLLVTPIIALLLSITVIGIPLALIIIALYLVLLAISVIYSSYYIGLLLGNGLNKKAINPFLALILGLLVFVILTSIPWLGGLSTFIFILFGLGASVLGIKNNIDL